MIRRWERAAPRSISVSRVPREETRDSGLFPYSGRNPALFVTSTKTRFPSKIHPLNKTRDSEVMENRGGARALKF